MGLWSNKEDEIRLGRDVTMCIFLKCDNFTFIFISKWFMTKIGPFENLKVHRVNLNDLNVFSS